MPTKNANGKTNGNVQHVKIAMTHQKPEVFEVKHVPLDDSFGPSSALIRAAHERKLRESGYPAGMLRT